MRWLPLHADVDAHRYALDATLALLGAIGAAVTVTVVVVLVLRSRNRPAQMGVRSRVTVVAIAVIATAASTLFGIPAAGSIGRAFPWLYVAEAALILIAGLGAILGAMRAASLRSLAWLFPGWLLAQCAGVHARELREPLPRFPDTLPVRTVHVGRIARMHPSVYPPRYVAGDLELSPQRRGPHSVIARAEGHGLTVERTFVIHAVEARGDELLPLVSGKRWLLRSADGRVMVTIAVGPSKIDNGLELHELTVKLEANDRDGKITLGGPSWVYEADGRLLSFRDTTPVVSSARRAAGDKEFPCQIDLLNCTCGHLANDPNRVRPGPLRCRGAYPAGVAEMFLGVLAAIFPGGDTSRLTRAYEVALVEPPAAR